MWPKMCQNTGLVNGVEEYSKRQEARTIYVYAPVAVYWGILL